MQKVETRTGNSINNAFFSVVKYVIALICSFTLRTLVIKYFGEEFLGINSLCSNILSILSITELGIGTSLIYKLYKPVAEDDKAKIKSLLLLYKKIYLTLGLIVLVLGICVTPFLGILTKQQTFNFNKYVIFLIFLVNSVLSYILGHRRALIFVYQKNYIEMIITSVATLIALPFQIIAMCVLKDVYLYVLGTLLITLIDSVILYIVTKNRYKEIKQFEAKEITREDVVEIKKNTFAMAFTKISTVVFKGVDSILVSALFGVAMLGLYSNYYVIFTYLFAISNMICGAIKASVGNYVASHTKEESYKLFKMINFGFTWFVMFCTISLVVLFQPFMILWSGVVNSNLLLPIMVPIAFGLYFYIDANRDVVRIFKEANGLFWKDKYIPLISAIINLALSVVLGKLIGVSGVIMASVISIVILPQWIETRILFKEYFNISSWHYWKRYIIYVSICLLSGGLTYYLSTLIKLSGISLLVVNILLCIVIPNVINFICFFKTDELKSIINFARGFLNKKNKNT